MSKSGTGEITACTIGESTKLIPDVGNTTEDFFGSQQGSRSGMGEEYLDLTTTVGVNRRVQTLYRYMGEEYLDLTTTVGVVDGETDASGSRRSHSWDGLELSLSR